MLPPERRLILGRLTAGSRYADRELAPGDESTSPLLPRFALDPAVLFRY